MPIATFRGEANVHALADRLYTGLTARQRQKVERALLRANPRLREIETMEEGTLLRVPDIAEVRPKANQEGGEVDAEVATRISDALQNYGENLRQRFERDVQETKEQQAVLKNRRLRPLFENSAAAKDVAASASKTLKRRANDSSKRLAATEKAIKDALTDLQKMV